MPPFYIYITGILLLITAATAQISIAVVPECYFPDGSLTNSSDYRACNKGANVGASMCCATANRSGDEVDVCVSNGLCAGSDGGYYRAGCTDETWESPACLRICMVGDYMSNNAPVHFCKDGTVCCGNEAVGEACCKKGKGFQLPTIGLSRITETITIKYFEAGSPTSTSTPTPTPAFTINNIESTSTTSSTATETPSETSEPTPSSTSTSGNETTSTPQLMPDTVKIAMAISVPVVSISLIITGILLWDSRRRRTHRLPPIDTQGITRIPSPDMKTPESPVEIGSSDTRYEWPTASQLEQCARVYIPSNYYRRPPTPTLHVNVYEMH
ncbi:hypothetical protein TWF481_004304 [Arthrobotrys musiformis]|uniref:Uncharacterized protein n=1 Tax=Arthrobotrys musiformis TaxID=47236 RepID=A0AAV9WK39_9PEZI